MFIKTWESHWGLRQDPFSCEDADKDLILSKMDPSAVHSGFGRLFGQPDSPAPGILFGEKGSGKSGLRLMMKRRLDELKGSGEARAICSEYIDFDGFLECFRRRVGVSSDAKAVAKAVSKEWGLADHLDSMLSLGVTQLVDEVLDDELKPDGPLSPKEKADLLLLTALYDSSTRRTAQDGMRRVASSVGLSLGRRIGVMFMRWLGLGLAAAIMLAPHVAPMIEGAPDLGAPWIWLAGGGAVLLLVLFQWAADAFRVSRLSAGARRIRVLQRDAGAVASLIRSVPSSIRNEMVLPEGTSEATRYELVRRFQAVLKRFGFPAWFVLVDRIDEPSALNGDPDGPRRFVETLLDHKLLQLPGLAMKLFLPIELEGLYSEGRVEALKRMRLDKSNLIPTMTWTGQELIEIARTRLSTCLESDARARDLFDLFHSDIDPNFVRDTLETLGTPRHALGFLSTLLQEYVRTLPGDLDPEDDRWRISLNHFNVVRSSWAEKSATLRRKLN
ncbi:MAG: hypothetical protein AAF682_17300 [Planctomycetota bacterium]